MNTRVRKAVSELAPEPFELPKASIPRLNDADTADQILAKRTELVIQKENFEIRLGEINIKLSASIANRKQQRARISPDTFKMEESWDKERKLIIIEMRKINNALTLFRLKRADKEAETALGRIRTFEGSFVAAAKTILDAATYQKIVDMALFAQQQEK